MITKYRQLVEDLLNWLPSITQVRESCVITVRCWLDIINRKLSLGLVAAEGYRPEAWPYESRHV